MAVWNAATKPSAMYSGQFEMRSVPLAGPPSSGGWTLDVPLSDPQAARNDEPRASAAAAAAPPPMKRRRDVRLAVRRAISWGSISWITGHGGCAFRRLRRGAGSRRVDRRVKRASGVVEHLLEILGGRDVGAGQHQ